MSDHVNPSEIEQDLHALVGRLCTAPPASRAQVFAQLIRQASLLFELEAGLERTRQQPESEPEPAPEQQAAPEPPVFPTLEGPFLRLRQGGKLVHDGSEHFVPEAVVAKCGLQHGDIVQAVPTGDGAYAYRAVCAGPLAAPGARREFAHIVELDADRALARTPAGVEITLSAHDMKKCGANRESVVSVAFLPDAKHNGRFLGRVLRVYPTDEESGAPPQRLQRRKRPPEAGDQESDPEPASFPQFALINGRRPVIALMGGRTELRQRLPRVLEDYGADVRLVPDPPTGVEVEIAVRGSDIVIGLTQSCSHVHWDAVKKHGRNHERLWVNAISQNPSGLRRQVESELIDRWQKWISEPDATD
ncbi:MAG TPA: hypothetical protein VNT01_11285 [Symbiobacteriaceae bacterium]|nr:hypothetical protein [Symbiobacteriaceae bacterium]